MPLYIPKWVVLRIEQIFQGTICNADAVSLASISSCSSCVKMETSLQTTQRGRNAFEVIKFVPVRIASLLCMQFLEQEISRCPISTCNLIILRMQVLIAAPRTLCLPTIPSDQAVQRSRENVVLKRI